MSDLNFKSTDIQSLRSKFTNEAFLAMKKEFPDEGDESIARFLIARNGDITKAMPFLKASIIWRSENLPIKTNEIVNELKKGKVYLHGQDKNKHALIVYRGRLNFPKERDIVEMIKMCIWWMETAIAALPEDKSQITFLFDRTGSSSTNMDVDFVKALAKVMQDNYPERLHKIILHPVGVLFYTGWAIAKFFIDKNTQDKVQPMLKFEGVKQFIDVDLIPRNMGGECDFVFDFAQLGISDEIKIEENELVITADTDNGKTTEVYRQMSIKNNEEDVISDSHIVVSIDDESTRNDQKAVVSE
mmetsp:Transcript_11222/g.10836  ORF Transcript_11222/g.10836 Transcript_11222/m.10836 type:complete len:301 (+) Transcript_11222:75-977(+)